MIALQFDEARSFSDGVAAVGVDRNGGVVDKSEKVTVPPKLGRVWDFSRGLPQVVVEQNGRPTHLYIDKLRPRGLAQTLAASAARGRMDSTSIVAEIGFLTFYPVWVKRT